MRGHLIVVYTYSLFSLLGQIDGEVADAALRCAAGDEYHAVAFGGCRSMADYIVQVLLRTDRTVVGLQDDEVGRYAGAFQFAVFEVLNLQAVVDTQLCLLLVAEFLERSA